MKKRRNAVAVFGLLLFLVFILFFIHKRETKNLETASQYVDGDLLQFNHKNGFYEEDFFVEIQAAPQFAKDKVKIYYTTDGSVPTTESQRYVSAIPITVEEVTKITSIRAVLEYAGECSEVYTRTYMVGKDAKERYSTPIVSITADPEDLYGYEKGILVKGKTWDDYDLSGENPVVADWDHPANYRERGDEWIRDGYVSIFDKEGSCILEQDVGVKVAGMYSSVFPQKSLMLIANKLYDKENPKFIYTLFPTKENGSIYSEVTSYNKLVVRNSGNDFANTMLRWNVCSKIAEDAGFPMVAQATPVAVYLNGEYYGMAQLQPSNSANNIAERLGIDDSYIEKFEARELDCAIQGGYNEAIHDLTNPDNKALFESLVDVDNMLLYYALECIMNNQDWPTFNFKIWRYTGDVQDTYLLKDNKFRCILFDTDQTLGYSRFEMIDRFDEMINADYYLLSFLLKVPEYREKYVQIVQDLLSTTFEPEYLLDVIETCKAEAEQEIMHMVEESPFEEARAMKENWEENVEIMREFAKTRKSVVQESLMRQCNLGDLYTLNIKSPMEGAEISWNTLKLHAEENDFSGEYASNYEVKMKCEAKPGYEFSHWIVNGEILSESSILTISKDKIKDGKVDVELVVKPMTGDNIRIERISAKGSFDWIELYNPYPNPVDLSVFYLTDDIDKPFQYPCPKLALAPYETIRINCKNAPQLSAYISNFNLKAGETLYVFSAAGDIMDQVTIPKMDEGEYYGRYKRGNEWRFFKENNQAGESNE